MQPGILRRSQLLDSLKEYLNNKSRLQPIIGLGSLTECVKAGAQSGEALYLCGVCVCRHSKADIRNHILGSLHRFNYIKTWHPHLVSKWQESSDLSKLAWPLMEMAKMLEEKEGPGEIQLLELEDDVYQRMATSSENDAVTLISYLRDIQGGTVSYSETTALHYPTESQRTVVLAQDESGWSQKSLKADIDSYEISADTNKTPPLLMHANVDPSPNSEVCLVNAFTSQLDAPEPSSLSEINSSFLDGYTGTMPLIGLNCVVECRSEDGSSYCWLCHCCRIRANKKDIIDHLTSSSHLVNYLMETHPEEVEEVTGDAKGNSQLLQSLAKKVEQEKGRGELKVVHVPETLCTLLTGKSYHWSQQVLMHKPNTRVEVSLQLECDLCPVQFPTCHGCIKMLQGEWNPANIQKKGIAVSGPNVNQPSAGVMPEKCALMKSKSKKRGKAKWKTVFNVSLPLTKGSVLMKRTSFNRDSHPVSPPSDSDLTSHPGSEIVDCELKYYNISFEFNNAEMSPFHSDADQYYYQQHFQNPYTPCDYTNLQMGGVGGHHDTCRDVAPYINDTRVNMPTRSADACAYCGSIAPYSNFTNVSAQAAPQNCGPQPTAYEASQGHHGWMPYPSLNTGPRMNPDQQFLPPVCSGGNDWSLTHSNAFSQPYEPQCAGSYANFSGDQWGLY